MSPGSIAVHGDEASLLMLGIGFTILALTIVAVVVLEVREARRRKRQASFEAWQSGKPVRRR